METSINSYTGHTDVVDVLQRRSTPQGQWFWFVATEMYIKWGFVGRDTLEIFLWDAYNDFERREAASGG